jgi:hypothetical protein
LAASNLVAGKAARVFRIGCVMPTEALAAFQAAGLGGFLSPGHRPLAAALGWSLPARWAGVPEGHLEGEEKIEAAEEIRNANASKFRDAVWKRRAGVCRVLQVLESGKGVELI